MDNDKDNSQIKKNNVTKTIKFKRSSLSEKIKEDSSSNKESVTKTVRFKKNDGSVKNNVTKTIRFKRDLTSKKEKIVSSVDESKNIEDDSTPKTVRLKPRRTLGNNAVKLSGNKEKIAVSKDAGVLRLKLNEKVEISENTSVGADKAIVADAAKSIEKTLKLKRPVSSPSSTKTVSSVADKKLKSNNLEKTLKLKRPGISKNNAVNVADKVESQNNTDIKKTLNLKKPSSEKNDAQKVALEKTLKLKRPSGIKTTTIKSEESNVEKQEQTKLSVEKTLKLKRPSGAGIEKKEYKQTEVSVEKTLKLKRPMSVHSSKTVSSSKVLENGDVEKTLKLKRPALKANSSLDSKLNGNKSTLKKLDKDVAIDVDIDKTRDSLSKLKLRPTGNGNVGSVNQKTVSLKSETDSKQIDKTDQNNIKIPPLPLKNSPETEVSESISDDLNLELEAALDALSIDDVKDVKQDVKVEKTEVLEEEIDDISDLTDLEEEISEKNKVDYGFAYVAVSLLTLVGLICFLYVSFQSLKLF